MVLLYLRLFPLRYYQIILVVALIFVILSGLWMVFGSFFMCIPVRGAWDTSIPHSCISRAVIWGLNAALQIFTDMVIVILPMPLLTKLQLPRRQKIALIIVFALGTL
jgi:cytochrome b subunit of formate dehydrogenase